MNPSFGGWGSLQAVLHGVEFGKPAALLLDQVVFHSPHALGSSEYVCPGRDAFGKQNLVSLARLGRPVFAVDGADASGIGLDPRYRVGACFQTRTDIELQCDGW